MVCRVMPCAIQDLRGVKVNGAVRASGSLVPCPRWCILWDQPADAVPFLVVDGSVCRKGPSASRQEECEEDARRDQPVLHRSDHAHEEARSHSRAKVSAESGESLKRLLRRVMRLATCKYRLGLRPEARRGLQAA